MPPVLTTATTPSIPSQPPPNLRLLRGVVFLYIALWIGEGALRKWIFPSLANPLLVVRDPVLLGMYALAYAKGVFPWRWFIAWIAGLGALATFVSFAATETPLLVTMYGLRADYLHLPLIFLLPNVLRRQDLRLLGKAWLVAAVGMAGLVLVQFSSGGGSYWNRGAGEGTQMLESAFGHIRPSGTFSYTNGLTGFSAITAAFFLHHLLEKRVYPRLLWLAAIPAILILVMLSGSRTAAGIIAIILAGIVFVCIVQRQYRAASIKLVVLLTLIIMLAGSFAVLRKGIDIFSSRFGSNNVEQRGFVGRYLDGYLQPFLIMDRAEWGGVGLGMGTNVAAGMLLGKRKFMYAEGEGGRVIFENGPVVGLAYLMLRLCITIYLGTQAVRALRLHAATLPFLIFSGCFNDVILGQFSQATELGYATIAGGLCLAACRAAEEAGPTEARDETEQAVIAKGGRGGKRAPGSGMVPIPAARKAMESLTEPVAARGRSAYAARLHGKKEERGEP